MVSRLPPGAIRRLAALRGRGVAPGGEPGLRDMPRGAIDVEQATVRVIARWGGELCGLLNAMTRGELAVLALQLGIAAAPSAPALRAPLWDHGASIQRGDGAVTRVRESRANVLA